MKYSVFELRKLWSKYHAMVHTNPYTPCDACPGDPCSPESFFRWLAKRERESKKQVPLQIVKGPR
jgi:hypothetical protein